nr:putative disease resistance RPP13-like protein 1 [Tanacetum cinerariifolium]
MAWVCVSDEFDVFNISKATFQCVDGRNSYFANLNLLQEALKQKNSKKRFLFVLDDVWNENYKEWELLQRPFVVGAPGSKVVTTRKTSIASVMDCVRAYHLDLLSNDEAISLFAQHALGEKNFDKHPTLKLHGEGIMKKCDGLPLALITLGKVLRTKRNDEEWEEVLNSELWYLGNESQILPALRLSYYDLPAHLKQIFAYCSLFIDAWEANLQQKMLLDDLDMEWTDLFEDSRNEITEYEVLKALGTHNKLRNLKICFYGGLKFPTWVGDPTFHEWVKILGSELHGTTDSCNGVSFPSLQILKFDYMHGWEIWSTNYVGLIPSLQITDIQGCAEAVFSSGAQGDREDEVFQVSNDDTAVAQRLLKDKQPEEKTNMDYLVKEQEKVHLGIKVWANITVTRVPVQEGAEGNVAEKKKVNESMKANLRKLLKYKLTRRSPVRGLKKPMSEWGMQNFPKSLVTLHLHGENSGLVSFAKANVGNRSRSTLSPLYLPSSLTFLHIHGFMDLESLSEGLQHLSCLEDLHIGSCPKLRDLPETLLPMLSCLSVSFCTQLQKKCRSGKGNYWPIISRIPSFDV